MIYILVFLSVVCGSEPNTFPKYWNETKRIEIYHTIKEVNNRIDEDEPRMIYSYNLKTKELKELEIEINKSIKED